MTLEEYEKMTGINVAGATKYFVRDVLEFFGGELETDIEQVIAKYLEDLYNDECTD